MVKRKTTRRKAPATRTRTVYRSAPRRRAKTGYDKIGPAMATVGLVAVNFDNLKGLANAVTNNGNAKITDYPSRVIGSKWVRQQLGKFVTSEALVKDGFALAGGYVAGEVVRKYAPTVIKKPIAKISKKIPKVI